MFIHLTVRARRLPVPLTDHRVAGWIWARLRRALPNAVSVVLMPNHPHLVTPSDDLDECRRTLWQALRAIRRSDHLAAAIEWDPVGAPDVLADVDKASRMIRYVALNPCRARLCDDPLAWPWSTHRDVMGAIADPWIDASRLAAALRRPQSGFADAFHRYVSSDPSALVSGTSLPTPAPPTRIAVQPLEALMAAAASATRGAPRDIERRGITRDVFLQLASTHGWRDTARLAALCGTTPRAVQLNRARADPSALAAARLCLGDPRLLSWDVGVRSSPNAKIEGRHTRCRAPDFAFGEV